MAAVRVYAKASLKPCFDVFSRDFEKYTGIHKFNAGTLAIRSVKWMFSLEQSTTQLLMLVDHALFAMGADVMLAT